MSLRYKFNKAEAVLQQLDTSAQADLLRLAARIRAAQRRLNLAAAPLMAACGLRCRGLCCRNIAADDLIALIDCILVWSVSPESMRLRIRRSLVHESLTTADCLFLDKGVGPCIFPDDAKPLKCIITFCGDETPVRTEIRQLRSAFYRFYWFLVMRRPALLLVL
jgi:hypothetical protein